MSTDFYLVDHKNKTYFELGSFWPWRPPKFYEEYATLKALGDLEKIDFFERWSPAVPQLLDCPSAKTEQELYERIAYYLSHCGFETNDAADAADLDAWFKTLAKDIFAWLQASSMEHVVLVNGTDGSMDGFDIQTYKKTGTRYVDS